MGGGNAPYLIPGDQDGCSQSPFSSLLKRCGKLKVLVVEDEKKPAMYLRKGLTESGFVVDVAERGDDGLRLALTGHYDIVVLDIMLPERDGWSVLAELRRSGTQIPVLFLTARDAVQDRVKGLQQGADDYLVKPFAFREFGPRLHALLRI